MGRDSCTMSCLSLRTRNSSSSRLPKIHKAQHNDFDNDDIMAGEDDDRAEDNEDDSFYHSLISFVISLEIFCFLA